MTHPLYTPDMLRLFLEARVVLRMLESGESHKAAARSIYRGIAAGAGLSWLRVRAAHHSNLRKPGDRAAIWAAMGYAGAADEIAREGDGVPASAAAEGEKLKGGAEDHA